MKIGEPYYISNMLLYPLFDDEDAGEVVDLKTAFSEGSVEIKETGVVNEVEIKYRGNEPLYIWEGEGIEGALQNRIIRESILIQRETSERVPALCVEEGRWAGDEKNFTPSYMAYPRVRSILLSSKGKGGLQKSVWDEIKRKQTTLKVKSLTNSMQDSYRNLNDELKRYIDDTEIFPSQRGFFVSTNQGFLGADLFGSPELFLKVWKRVLLSYALDAYEDMFFDERRAMDLEPDFLLKELEKIELHQEGEKIKESGKFILKVFVFRKKKLHISLFPKTR